MRPATSRILIGDALDQLKHLPSESVHCVVTSPPYWGLRQYGVDGQIGLERSPEEYIERLVVVFREVRRVLRCDGTAWVVIGDSYATGGGSSRNPGGGKANRVVSGGSYPMTQPNRLTIGGLKPKELVGIPWRFAFALQTDGWWLRADCIWEKPNAQPESVRDRPSRSHEYLFLLTKSHTYYYDQDAIREPHTEVRKGGGGGQNSLRVAAEIRSRGNFASTTERWYHPLGRNRRSVWRVATRPLREEHFAAYPEELIEPCILAGTSERGCCEECGAPMRRRVERRRCLDGEPVQLEALRDKSKEGALLGWEAGCTCEAKQIPCTVLDPFVGSGTTGRVALRHGRDFDGIELNPKYAAMTERRIRQINPLFRARGGAG